MVEVKQVDAAIRVTLDRNRHYLSDKETLQLAKDLLNACGVSYIICDGDINLEAVQREQKGSDVFSGMSLDEIQKQAGKMYDDYKGGVGYAIEISQMTMLIANLAARMKEQNGINMGDTVTCSCGNVFRVF